MAALFGPFTAVWFLILGALGAWHLADDLSILRAFNPWYGLRFLLENGFLGFVILGSVFLVVTGAEALYADMGHFGKKPIQAAWMCLVFPCLALNYLGQGSLVLDHPAARHNPFWEMVPGFAYWPVLIMATIATVIASQAVITGAFSMTQQAVQLGLLPRIEIKRTSETQAGQIFVPAVNQFLLIGVLVLLFAFRSSHKLASAYGIAVTGAMFVDTLLAYVVIRRVWKWPLWQTGLLLIPLAALDMVFIASNMLKIPDGAWLPLVFGGVLVLIMWTWTRGAGILTAKTRRDSVPLVDLMEILRARAPHRAPGTAIFLTSDPEMTPGRADAQPQAQQGAARAQRHPDRPHHRDAARPGRGPGDDREGQRRLQEGHRQLRLHGKPEPAQGPGRVPQAGAEVRHHGHQLLPGRRSIVPSANSGMPLWQDRLFIYLMKNAANPTDFFKIPPGRVVELGAQVTV
jgi:KUP system potassium uptake protein